VKGWPNLIAKAIALATAASIVALCFASFSRWQNMTHAREQVAVITPVIHRDARFQSVRLHPFTKYNGSLIVTGVVASQAALDDLHRIVDENKPAIRLVYTVFIDPEFTPWR
jgi:hypothetical protein